VSDHNEGERFAWVDGDRCFAWEADDKRVVRGNFAARLRILILIVLAIPVVVACYRYYVYWYEPEISESEIQEIVARRNAEQAQRAAEEAHRQKIKVEDKARAKVEESRRLAARALLEQNRHPDLSLLLAMAALQDAYTPEAYDAMQTVLSPQSQRKAYLHGHTGKALHLAFSPDGKMLATTGEDGNVMLWDASTYQQLAILDEHVGKLKNSVIQPGDEGEATDNPLLDEFDSQINSVRHLAFSPDGKRLASGDHNGKIILWRTEGQSRLGELNGHMGEIRHLVFSPDGAILASADDKGGVMLWDAAKKTKYGKLIHELQGHEGRVFHLAFSPDGKILASAGNDGKILLWDVEQQTRLGELAGHSDWVRHLVFSPDGKTLASAGYDRNVILWDVERQAKRGELAGHAGPVFYLAFSPDGGLLASAGNDGRVLLWDAIQQTRRGDFNGHTGWIFCLAFSPDGALLASAGQDGKVMLWDTAKRTQFGERNGHVGSVFHLAFSPDGDTLASAGEDGKIILFGTEVSQGTFHKINKAADVSPALNANGDSLAWVPKESANVLMLQETQTLCASQTCPEARAARHNLAFLRPRYLAFSANGEYLAAIGQDGKVILLDSDVLHRSPVLFQSDADASALALNRDGSILAVGGDDHKVTLWDVREQTRIGEFSDLSGSIESLAFCNETLAASDHRKVMLWDVARKTRIGEIDGAGYGAGETSNPLIPLAFDNDDCQTLAAGFPDKTILYSVRSSTNKQELGGGGASHLAFNRDGSLLAVGEAGQINLWNVGQGALITQFTTDSDHEIVSLAFNDDGDVLTSVSDSGALARWHVARPGRACAIANRNMSRDEWETFMDPQPYRAICPELPEP
jgi:WD40 repeat protein